MSLTAGKLCNPLRVCYGVEAEDTGGYLLWLLLKQLVVGIFHSSQLPPYFFEKSWDTRHTLIGVLILVEKHGIYHHTKAGDNQYYD